MNHNVPEGMQCPPCGNLVRGAAQTEQGQGANTNNLCQLDQNPNLVRAYYVPTQSGKSEVRPGRNEQEDDEYGTPDDVSSEAGQQECGDYHRYRSENGTIY
jgi:hypothetical protein